MNVGYETTDGIAYCGDAIDILRGMETECIDLVITSPPYALHFKKEYGNAEQAEYLSWFEPFAFEIFRVLKSSGSFVLNIGGAWTPGKPVRSLYIYRLVLHLCDTVNFNLCQEFFWYNPAKMPAPAEWVNVRRIRVKDSTEYIFWFGKTEFPYADNRNVLQPYSKDMERLIRKGVKETVRPSGHAIKKSFSKNHGGSIPGNLISCGNNESNSTYLQNLKTDGRKIHPARFPAELPKFFIKFLTNPGDIVLDPFAGSNTTGFIAEKLGRRWIAIEKDREYLDSSKLRFSDLEACNDKDTDSVLSF